MIKIQTELIEEHLNHKLDLSADADIWLLYCFTCKQWVARGETQYEEAEGGTTSVPGS